MIRGAFDHGHSNDDPRRRKPLGVVARNAHHGRMTPKEILDPDERAEQLTAAPKAVPEDAAPRITLSEGSDGATRIDIADTAVVRPGGPDGAVPDAD